MKQIDIDKYNKGQDIYYLKLENKRMFITKKKIMEFKIIKLYDFLFSPNLGWRETFDNSPEYQKEFWAWMVKNNYACESDIIYDGNNYVTRPTHQMLTGYILEFMQDRMKQ